MYLYSFFLAIKCFTFRCNEYANTYIYIYIYALTKYFKINIYEFKFPKYSIFISNFILYCATRKSNIFKGLKISFLQKNPRRDSGLKFFPKIFDD